MCRFPPSGAKHAQRRHSTVESGPSFSRNEQQSSHFFFFHTHPLYKWNGPKLGKILLHTDDARGKYPMYTHRGHTCLLPLHAEHRFHACLSKRVGHRRRMHALLPSSAKWTKFWLHKEFPSQSDIHVPRPGYAEFQELIIGKKPNTRKPRKSPAAPLAKARCASSEKKILPILPTRLPCDGNV